MNTPGADATVGPFLRTTVLTTSKAVDVVLPTDQPVAGLLPALIDLLDVPSGGWGHQLVRVDGTVLAQDTVLAHSGLTDGVQLRLLESGQAPPDPVVYDLVDAVEQDRPAAVWSEQTRRVGLSLMAAALVIAAALLAVANGGIDLPSALLVAAGLALVACVPTKLAEQHAVSWVWCGTAWGAGAIAAAFTDQWPWWVSVAGGVPVVLVSLGWCAGRFRAMLTALGAWAVLAGVAGATWLLTQDRALTAATAAAVSGLLIGLAPRLALASTGSFALDGRLVAGEEIRQGRVAAVVADAHLSLLAAVVVCALTGGGACYLAATSAPRDGWIMALVAALSLAWLVRVRHFPLLLERLALGAAAIAGGFGLARAVAAGSPQLDWVLVLVFLLAAAAVAAMTARPVAELVAANVRRWAARLETLAIVAVVPLLIGAFGVYADLLDTF